MAFKEIASLDADNTISLGGINKKTGKPNPKTAEGYFLGTRKVESKMSQSGECSLHFLQTPKGNLGIWGKTDLDRKLVNVAPGTMIRVTQTAMQKCPGKADMYKFKVEIDDENTINVASGEVGNTEEADDYEDDVPELSYGSEEETDVDAEEEELDVAPPARATRPAAPAATPDAARQAKVKELLNKGRTQQPAKR
jgi:hypothetical protein